MKKGFYYNKLGLGLFLFCTLLSEAYASAPVWTYNPLTATSMTVRANESAIVQYRVTNQSPKHHTLRMQPIRGITSSGCVNSLGYKESCVLTLQINGSLLAGNVVGGPVLCEQYNPQLCFRPMLSVQLNVQTASPLPPPASTTLQINTQNLGLSVNDSLQPELTGNPRSFVITNTGSKTALNVTYSVSPALPSGTTISPASCGTMAPGDTCTLVVTPGSTPSVAAASPPAPNIVTVKGTNTNAVTVAVNVLTYGSIYQEGYIFQVDDTQGCSSTPCTGSIGGKIVSLTDQAPAAPNGVVWSSNGTNSTTVSLDAVPYVAEFSEADPLFGQPSYAYSITFFNLSYPSLTPPPASLFTPCLGPSDGKCNTGNIINFYSYFIPYIPSYGVTPLTMYAAGLCDQYAIDSNGHSPCSSGTCYNDWYLPAICEMGPFVPGGTSMCSIYPQANILSNLTLLMGDPFNPSPSTSCPLGHNCIYGDYWSSTESNLNFQDWVVTEHFDSASGAQPRTTPKSSLFGVRCVRPLSP